ncbi:MAG: polysaccharide deacetylase family protein, partial [Anaerolineae bacterium]|nr:polysaccharide deacetylase family protein [Anaerolineae bacterium]
MAGLLLGVMIAGAALLAYADVEGVEWRQTPAGEAGGPGGWSHHGTLAARPRSLTLPSAEDQVSSLQRTERAEEEVPVEVRRPSVRATPIPLPTPDGSPRQLVVPILMYHHIGEPGPAADAIRSDLSVSPENFEGQLRYLVEHGYEPTTLESLVLHLQVGRPLPGKPVILTFDDGFRDQYTAAYPLLRKYGFAGTFFVITRFADEGRPDYMSWAEIELLHAGGMEIGSHSYTHPGLEGKTFDYVVWQVLGSKEAIEARTREPVRFFSYPSGQYDQLVVDVLRSAGYWTAVTVKPG